MRETYDSGRNSEGSGLRGKIISRATRALALAAAVALAGCAAGPTPRLTPERPAAPERPAGPVAPSAAIKAELAPTGALRIAVFTGNPLIGTRGETSGDITGPTVSLGRALAERVGVPAFVIEYTSTAKLVEAAGANAWDVTVIGVDPARNDVVDFAPAHLTVDLTYLVGPGSNLQSVAEADRHGVRIAAPRATMPAIVLSRSLTKATFVQTKSESSAFELLKSGKVQAIAQNRSLLTELATHLPGSRVLDDRLLSAELAFALPKGRRAALAYVSDFIKQAKASGLVQRVLEEAGLRGVDVAPDRR